MVSELVAIIDYYENEKGIDREALMNALEEAMLMAASKHIGPARELYVKIDTDSGKVRAFAKLICVKKVSKPYDEIDIEVARKIKEDVELDEEVEVEVTPKELGRIAAQTAKQVMMQKLRQVEKNLIYEEYKDRAGEIISGVVRRFERGDVWIDLGRFEAVLPDRERVPTEDYSIGDRIRAYVLAVENPTQGPEIVLSRSHPNFVKRLFEREVSEIVEGSVEIRAIAREAGYRTKIAVYSSDAKVDPVGACVGLRGSRVKNIVKELNNEKIDIIPWSDNIEEYVSESLKPAQVISINSDREAKVVYVSVSEDDLSKAIGRKGQNARLTSKLTEWDIKISRDDSAQELFDQRVANAAKEMSDKIALNIEQANELVKNGMNSVEVLTFVEAADIAQILNLSNEESEDIIARAKKATATGV